MLFLGNPSQRDGQGILQAKITKFQIFHFHLFWAKGFLKAEGLLQNFILNLQLDV